MGRTSERARAATHQHQLAENGCPRPLLRQGLRRRRRRQGRQRLRRRHAGVEAQEAVREPVVPAGAHRRRDHEADRLHDQQGMTPCLEFEPDSTLGYVDRSFTSGASGTPGYYDNRYWLMWKLPMYGCTDSSEVIKEIAACKAEYPNAMIKCIGFDATRQMQVAGFLVQKP